jgi:anhydro-N-acetylmuramic acid kinase
MNKTYKSIGLMSGTSLDGVDLVYSEIISAKKFEYRIIHAKTYEYSIEWLQRLKDAFTASKKELFDLDISYGKYLGELVVEFKKEFQIEDVDFIASHGHTILHKPNEGYTLQIGNGNEILKLTKHNVIYDFRTQDVDLGGQGAPLVPIGDKFLFSEYDFCLNLGGFVNVSFEDKGQRKAFDICPVNIVMNHYMHQIGEKYDDKGKLASSGEIDNRLLNRLNSDPFYKLSFPKSLGYEFVVENVFPVIDESKLELKNLLRTFVEHVALKISEILTLKKNSMTLITGGGAYNEFLIERISELSGAKLVIPNEDVVEFKEALIFSLLGVLKLEDKPNCLKSVTGAKYDHSSGKILSI